MTTNIIESMNAYVKDSILVPIFSLIMTIQKELQKWFLERKNKARNHTTTSNMEAIDMILKKHSKKVASLYKVTTNLYEFLR